MINPIVIIVSAAVFLAMLTICVINKPKKPIVTGTVILILVCFITFTFLIVNAILSIKTSPPDSFICFLTMNNSPVYNDLAFSFSTFVKCDITLIIGSLVSLFVEMLLILRKGQDK